MSGGTGQNTPHPALSPEGRGEKREKKEEKRFPVAGVVVIAVVLVALIAASAEAAVKFRGEGARTAAYIGGAGAWLATLAGLPFLLKIARTPDPQDGSFWKYWGLGLMTRTLVGLMAAAAMLQWMPEAEVGTVVLALVYFVALMIETVWVARRVSQA